VPNRVETKNLPEKYLLFKNSFRILDRH